MFSQHAFEIRAGARFAFGRNWLIFLSTLARQGSLRSCYASRASVMFAIDIAPSEI